MSALLEVRAMDAWYGAVKVLHGIEFDVPHGGVTTLIGANGAGKTSTLRAICNALVRREGSVRFADRPLEGLSTHAIIARGIAHVPDGRGTFAPLTVEQNLRLGGHTLSNARSVTVAMNEVYALFPKLKEREHQQAGTLSGGEQQMLAIGRALMADPKLMLLDEPSLGLAPMLVEEIFGIVRQFVTKENMTVLLVEQNAAMALDLADHGYVMENGRIVLEGSAASLRENSDIKEFYLGLNEGGARKSYRETKRYRRRKRWLS